jgi:hypothetical protein
VSGGSTPEFTGYRIKSCEYLKLVKAKSKEKFCSLKPAPKDSDL